MACNSCSKAFTLFRPEKGCPSCGFSYCSKCLKNKVFIQKLNSEVLVCIKCKQSKLSNEPLKIDPPDAYYKRIGGTGVVRDHRESTSENPIEKEISERLMKLKQDKLDTGKNNNNDVSERLQKLKGNVPSTSNAELISRLANLKGVPKNTLQSKPVVSTVSANKSEQEQVEDLMKQYIEQGSIDKTYKDDFDGIVRNLEARLEKLKGSKTSELDKDPSQHTNNESEDEEDTIRKIIEKMTAEAKFEDTHGDPAMDELPFCEICNEDANMRCLGCKYLFCKQCFKDHADEDDGCNKFEPYNPPKNFVM